MEHRGNPQLKCCLAASCVYLDDDECYLCSRQEDVITLAHIADLPGLPTKCCQRVVVPIIPYRALERIKRRGKPDENWIKNPR